MDEIIDISGPSIKVKSIDVVVSENKMVGMLIGMPEDQFFRIVTKVFENKHRTAWAYCECRMWDYFHKILLRKDKILKRFSNI